ncbi:hypothetical protein KGF56_001658 [Candida oxycetoniae]|uniref:FAD-binding domain-containing protein n=1 Tax=Candida oxycetoniae TaxID=497107 RepID=A0AAI9T0A0_9ASCO|nr:uncharacterized protein KGF56_001658 [Candida oxycetoniae]KAI3405640.2 hypothetical protein KGF56_001658 [Candida oxycetoniae]
MTSSSSSKYSFQKPKVELTFVIVGAGLGGVSAAIALTLAGHKVKLLEAAPELGEVGAGIQIPPPSTKILDVLGCLDAVDAVSIHPENIYIHRYSTGEVISKQNLVPYVKEKYNGMYLHIHRADYHQCLVERAKELDVEIFLNSRVDTVDFENGSVTTSQGVTHFGDVIVGYDGVKSRTREQLTGKSDGAYNTGDLAYRALIDVEDMKKVPGLEKYWEKPSIHFWWGPTLHIVLYFLQGGKTCNIVGLCPDTLPNNVLRQEANHDELLQVCKDWDQDLHKIFNLIDDVGKWRLQDSRELKTWVHNSGNAIILGDASHSTLPYLASGASQAVEDGAVLAGLFSKIESRDQIHEILKMTESLRKWRSSQVVQGSANCRNIYHLHDGEEQQIRDSKLYDKTPKLGCPNRFADPVFQDFLWGYNAFEEVERAWTEYKNGKMPTYTYPNLYEE